MRKVGIALAALAVVSTLSLTGAASAATGQEGFHVTARPMSSAVPSTHVSASATYTQERVCGRPAPGHATCFAVVRHGGVTPHAVAPNSMPSGYGPADLRAAYNLPVASSAQSGRTIAIVDAYDDPKAEADLATYRAQYGLPACTTANGCFRKINQRGGSSYPAASDDWAGEISLDVDMASAICPTCKILLVEADDTSLQNLGSSVDRAVAFGAQYVSNSYGGGEFDQVAQADAQFYDHPGVVVTASTGDSGYAGGVAYPASSPYVTAVGGTTLRRSGSSFTESAWSGAGSGCSGYEAKPAQQTDTGCARRSVADVAAVADPYTGVAVYNSYDAPGWDVYGGTSAASPIIAGVYALAGTPRAGDYPNLYPYQSSQLLTDVTSGNNGSCGSYLCTGRPGYDGPTGLGTPNGTGAFTLAAPVRQQIPPRPTATAGGKPRQTLAPRAGTGRGRATLPARR